MRTTTLPWPPSTNRLYRSPRRGPLAGRTLLSAEARAYKAKAMAMMHHPVPLAGKVGVRIVAHPPDRRRRDLDNLAKIVLDCCKDTLFVDDSEIDHLTIERGEIDRPAGSLLVEVWPL